MTKKQQQIIGGGLAVCLLILVAGYFLLVKPKKTQVAGIKASTASEQASNVTLRGQIAMLQQQQAGLVGKQVLLRQVAQRIPSDPEVPALIRQLTQIETSAGVDVVSITPGTPTAGTAAAATTTPTTGATGTAATGVHPGAVSAAATYQTIPITLAVQGNYSQLVMMLDSLENLQRLYVVKSLAIAPNKAGATGTSTVGPDGKTQIGDVLSATVTGEVYETSADTTNIDLPALNGAATPATSAPVTTSVH